MRITRDKINKMEKDEQDKVRIKKGIDSRGEAKVRRKIGETYGTRWGQVGLDLAIGKAMH